MWNKTTVLEVSNTLVLTGSTSSHNSFYLRISTDFQMVCEKASEVYVYQIPRARAAGQEVEGWGGEQFVSTLITTQSGETFHASELPAAKNIILQ